MAALKAAVELFKDSLSDICPTGQFQSLAADGDAVVATFADADGKRLRVNLTYFEPGSYPRSGCLVLLEDHQNRYAERISALSERFQDAAALATVLSKVSDILDIPMDEEALRAVEGNQHAGQAEGMEEDVSEEAMSEDGSGYVASDSDYAGDDHSDDEQDDDKELLIECGQRQGRWARYEDELERAHATQQALSMDQGKASKQQIFSSQEAFKMLSNELLGFIRRQFQGVAEVSADSVGDDVFTWNVEIWRSAFKPDCPMAKDMAEVSTKWAVSSVQLRFSFMRGLHPFYPPTLEVVRPHLSCPLPGALASHPLLRLEHWDPMMNMSQLLDRIKEFLEEFGRVDVNHPRNSHPTSALTPVQIALAKLEALTDVRPACYAQSSHMYEARSTRGRSDSPTDVLQQMKKQRVNENESTTAPQVTVSNAANGVTLAGPGSAAHLHQGQIAWAKGVGYGYGSKSGPVWDAKATQAAQEAQDEQLCGLLQGLAAALNEELAGSPAEVTDGDDANTQPNAADATEPAGGDLTPQQQECLQSVRSSVLLPLLAREFGNVAFPEMVSRHQYYKPLLSVLLALCRPASDQLLAANIHADEPHVEAAGGATSSNSQQVQSIAAALRGLVRGATMYRERMAKVLEQQREGVAAGSSSAAAAAGSGSSVPKKVNKETEALVQEAQRSMAIADLLLETTDKLQHLLTAEDVAAAKLAQPSVTAAATTTTAAQRGPRTRRATSRSAGAASADADIAAEGATQAAYQAALKPLVLDNAKISNRHKFGSDAARDPMGLKQRMQKVTSEMAGVERLVDVNESSSIFVRIDEDNVFLWKALITGPDDTPYSNGCFIFDFFFPPEYPRVPPKVLIVTTGGGTVRFNPNLYNCGKVCLSLLGTWSGGQGEGWDPNVSTALQVLLSIQSLILVEKPYYNEPGYEQRAHEPQSKEYNKNIREATMRWAMIDQLKNPPPEFADVIRTHFRLRAPDIRKQVRTWIDEAGGGAHADRLKALQTQLEQELAKLA